MQVPHTCLYRLLALEPDEELEDDEPDEPDDLLPGPLKLLPDEDDLLLPELDGL